ncbi:serine/threonine-protein kinase [Pleurocapsa sp. FMAR1]|uniref:serine/threonine-protein kinase n=1 Tax=Pleurocapsa sp. FMAR1 TaxID=3040204 RepID=UPI0029C94564|nr:serine/threonine-protein kinase [Pleurocapsa sp. FMAR1]
MSLDAEYQSQYQILHSLGQGQYGQVFCAAHLQTKELVALKELDRKQFPTKMFLRELGFLVTLQHPNIVSCRGLEYSPTRRYLVMDYCQGGTLRELIESEEKIELLQSLKLITGILSGLEYASDRNIVHRDLKPENILLEPQENGWTARIADFGIARLASETNSQPSGNGDTGSPAYMAPEQFYGRYSHASDLYAVGVMLYELLVGERPFSGIYQDLRNSHLSQTVSIPQTIPFLLRSTISKALQKLPQRRFASAAEMLKSIKLATVILSASTP